MGENSLVETTCSRNGNLSQFPGTYRPASSKLATDIKDQTAFGSTVTFFQFMSTTNMNSTSILNFVMEKASQCTCLSERLLLHKFRYLNKVIKGCLFVVKQFYLIFHLFGKNLKTKRYNRLQAIKKSKLQSTFRALILKTLIVVVLEQLRK